MSTDGFTLVEVTIVIAIVGVLATLIVPPVASAQLDAKERRMESILREIHFAQFEFEKEMKARGCPPHFGFLGELTAQEPLRDVVAGEATWGRSKLEHPLLAARVAYLKDGIYQVDGYLVRVGLPDEHGDWCFERRDRPTPQADPADGQGRYVVWAWPLRAGFTGRRAFSVGLGNGRTGEVEVIANGVPHSGSASRQGSVRTSRFVQELWTKRASVVVATGGSITGAWLVYGGLRFVLRRRRAVAVKNAPPATTARRSRATAGDRQHRRAPSVVMLVLSGGLTLLNLGEFPFSIDWTNQGIREVVEKVADFSGLMRPMPR